MEQESSDSSGAVDQAEEIVQQIQERAQQHVVPPTVAKSRSRWFLSAALVALCGFVILLLRVRANPRREREVVFTLRMQQVKHPSLSIFMRFISWFGFRPQSLVLPAAAVGGTWFSGLRREAFYLVVAWLASLLSWTTKRFVKRPRPFGDGILVREAGLRDTSFPSGHTLHYTSFWGFFAYLCFTELRGKWSRWGPVVAITSVIGAVGPSRIYLGHHWLTDVLASYSLGIGLLASLIGIHRRKIGDSQRERSTAAAATDGG